MNTQSHLISYHKTTIVPVSLRPAVSLFPECINQVSRTKTIIFSIQGFSIGQHALPHHLWIQIHENKVLALHLDQKEACMHKRRPAQKISVVAILGKQSFSMRQHALPQHMQDQSHENKVLVLHLAQKVACMQKIRSQAQKLAI